MKRGELERLRAWGLAKIATGEEPPWARYQYMKLCEAIDGILAERDAVKPQTKSPPREGLRSGTHLRLVEKYPLHTA